MQQLFVRDQATTIFFQDGVTIEAIIEWISEIIWMDNDNFLDLSEPHSCRVRLGTGNNFVISGDEDSIDCSIETVTPVL